MRLPGVDLQSPDQIIDFQVFFISPSPLVCLAVNNLCYGHWPRSQRTTGTGPAAQIAARHLNRLEKRDGIRSSTWVAASARHTGRAGSWRRINPQVEVLPVPERFKRSSVKSRPPDGQGIVFACVDRIATRRLLWEPLRHQAAFFVVGRMSAEVLWVLVAGTALRRAPSAQRRVAGGLPRRRA
jgi:hypothetical protein